MSRLKQIETFVSVANRGSLTAAATAEGIAPGVVSRRLDALEARLGVKLLLRTTRRVTLTFEGSAYLEDCQRILRELGDAEASVSLGGVKARGHLRLSAPAGFGRRHVAPLIMQFLDANPEVTVNLDLSDRLVDLVNEGVDCAIRVGELTDSSLVSIRLAENRRVVVASPDYLARHGTPQTLADLSRAQLPVAGPAARLAVPRRRRRSSASRSRACSNATTARCCTNGRWRGGGWPGARCGKSATTCNAARWCRCWTSSPHRRPASMPSSRSASTCRCACACSSTT